MSIQLSEAIHYWFFLAWRWTSKNNIHWRWRFRTFTICAVGSRRRHRYFLLFSFYVDTQYVCNQFNFPYKISYDDEWVRVCIFFSWTQFKFVQFVFRVYLYALVAHNINIGVQVKNANIFRILILIKLKKMILRSENRYITFKYARICECDTCMEVLFFSLFNFSKVACKTI